MFKKLSTETLIVFVMLTCVVLVASAAPIRQEALDLIAPTCSFVQFQHTGGNPSPLNTLTTAASGPMQVVYGQAAQVEGYDSHDNWTFDSNTDKLGWCFDDGTTRDKSFMVSFKLMSFITATDLSNILQMYHEGTAIPEAISLRTDTLNTFLNLTIPPFFVTLTPGDCIDPRYDSFGTVTHNSYNHVFLAREILCHDRH